MKFLFNSTSLVFLCLACLSVSCSVNGKNGSTKAENVNVPGHSVSVTGKVKFPKDDYVTLYRLKDQGTEPLDSVKTDKDGAFSFTVPTEMPGFYLIGFYNLQYNELILHDGDVEILADGNAEKGYFSAEGSDDTANFYKFLTFQGAFNSKSDSLKKLYYSTDDKESVALAFEAASAQAEKDVLGMVKEFDRSVVGALAAQMLDPDKHGEVMWETAEKLHDAWPNMPQVKAFHETIQKSRKLAIGSPAPEISLNDPAGNNIKLSSLKGKYVMIDFWASWCGPCRKENPNVVRMYKKFSDKGFEIYGVSLDKDKGKWERAIEADGLTWKHVSDLKFWQSEGARTYNVTGIPMTYLIDKEGVIIGKNLRGEALEARLTELFAAE